MKAKRNINPGGQDQTHYKTRDIYLAAFLKARDVPLESFEKEGEAVVFVFRDLGNVEDLVEEYFCGGTVQAQRFKSELKGLKSAIYDGFAGRRT
jgi:hypothetical protein